MQPSDLEPLNTFIVKEQDFRVKTVALFIYVVSILFMNCRYNNVEMSQHT